MALNTAAVRRDLPYLRRRVTPAGPENAAAEPVSTRSTDTASPSRGLSLGAPVSSATALASNRRPSRPRQPEPFTAPTIDEVRELGGEHPVLRLDARRSAIGSLIVSGAYAIAWESSTRVTGALTLTSSALESVGTSVMTGGNRALVGFDDGDAIVALRHLHELRRALFVGNGSEPLGIQLFDGSSFTVPADAPPAGAATGAATGTAAGSRMLALTLLRVNAFIELRAEPVARGLTPAELHREFGYQLTAHVDPRQPRMR
ncbi:MULTISPECIES: hypothetical protein [Subtercola]|uniref:Uncharacterized protein n=1 Tax=Subtercola vilae TaxID=2056433 RepID=A0A4T2C5H5_9MICO|nr:MULTISPECIES: hypothetical protein [Subtercola]MEA9984770.1 hypothetical protein [Subtercola sp. RTI3]TIH38999.1 hypothetical protein D4765_05385 [Subtercola vilae]